MVSFILRSQQLNPVPIGGCPFHSSKKDLGLNDRPKSPPIFQIFLLSVQNRTTFHFLIRPLETWRNALMTDRFDSAQTWACKSGSVLCLVIVPLLAAFATATASGNPGEDLKFFESKVRPLLIEHCYECHSSESGRSKGGLRLDSRQGWRDGGDSGQAIKPNHPEASLLIQAIRYGDPDLEMPPDGKLDDAQIKLLEEWVRRGAFDPREGRSTAPSQKMDLEKGRQFWAFQTPEASPPPVVEDAAWPSSQIDHFILHHLEAAGLDPNPGASDRDLIRRLYFDLTGLPPTPSQLQESLLFPAPTRIANVVDRLLADRHFGETWGRHWLDLARYSESTGGGRSALLPQAWRYRNYVIDAFNADKPFDLFLREQIAGDLMPYSSDHQRAEQLIATAFLVLGPKNLDLQDKELLRMNTVDEQIDTVGRVFMGMTISCARCHDHKFDPIPTQDYYALAGIFRSTRTLKRSNVSTLTLRDLPTSNRHRQALASFLLEKKKLDQELKRLKALEPPTAGETLSTVENAIAELSHHEPDPIPQTLGVTDETLTEDYQVCIRGNVHQRGEDVPRGFLRAMTPPPHNPPSIPHGQSGRLELAEWMSNPAHPLVARVWVNRVWSHLFGSGLVRSVDNFGTQGDRPTHPELLDHLASRFVHDEWSTKRLIRAMVLSKTYQQSTAFHPEKAAADPQNRTRWRMERKRLTAEAIRDAMLLISGTLSEEAVDCLFPEAAQKDTALQKVTLDVPSLVNPAYRSVYIPVLREEGLNPLLRAFDFANPSFPVGRRNQSILPTQALYLMNSEFVQEQALRAATRLLADFPTAETVPLLEQAYLRALGRRPSTEESQHALTYLGTNHSLASEQLKRWSHFMHSLFASVDYRFLK